ncbi:MAG: Txe/YoeB family addiction module toxin [Xenococcus sp. (in: cyanobacteria)]
MRKLAWGSKAWQDYLYWQRCDPASAKDARECAPRESQDKKTLKRINRLIQDTLSNPFEGIGKPEPLKENLSGFWSRRIDETNRLVYAIDDDYLTIISCRYHYQS